MDEWELEKGRNDDYEYGYDYLYEENETRPTDAVEDADEPEDGDSWREEDEEALLRMENAARNEAEFRAVQEVWDNNDASRERWKRLHEVMQGDTAVETGTDTLNATVVPLWLNDPTVRQLQRGNFLDYLSDCPYEMHDLTGKAYLRKIIEGTKEEHKELLFFLYLRQFSPQRVAALRGQTDRNIRKVRDVAIRKLRKKVYKALKEQVGKSYSYLTKQEREFLEDYEAKEGRAEK